MKGERELQLLVCSGNMGNACIDEVSLCHWIPDDGRCNQVIQPNNKYPIKMAKNVSTSASAGKAGFDAQQSVDRDDDESEESDFVPPFGKDLDPSCEQPYDETYSETDQFDMIVFGLQESTFDPPPVEAVVGSPISLLGSPTTGSEQADRVVQQVIGAGGYLVKNTKKTISQFQNITANRDYTKRSGSFGLGSLHGNSSPHPAPAADGITSEQERQRSWAGGTHVLHNLMQLRLPSYSRVVSFQRGEMRLVVWAHQDLLEDVEVVHVSAQNTGRAGLANKGGIVAELLVQQTTRLAFLTAHLEAHEGAAKYATRVSTIADILAGTKEKQHDCTLTAHYSFVMGDLNFRTELPNHADLEEEEHKQIVRDMTARKDWKALNEIDELARALRNKECLVGFQTPLCNFPPTFKVERQPGYAYIDKRRPSYTDRILWKTGHGLSDNVKPMVYEPIDDFASSDHKPIRAAFKVMLNRPLKMRPMLARRRSVINLGAILKKSIKNQTVVFNERYHLFVSEIFCSIISENKSSVPNPYVVLISDPPAALQQRVKKGWKKIKKNVRKAFKGSDRMETNYLNPKGFPRSSVMKQTFVANWHEEEIHSEINTHSSTGIPIDLTGAMLRLTVMDCRPQGTDDVVLGTFPFNLVELIRSCRPPHHGSQSTMSMNGARSNRMSLIGRFRKSGEGSGVGGDATNDDHDPIVSVVIDEPLLKNGVETGRIHAKIETWWMNEKTAKLMLGAGPSQSLKKRDSSKRQQRRSSLQPVDEYGTTEDGRQVMLSGRRERPSLNHEASSARSAQSKQGSQKKRWFKNKQ